MCNTNSFITNLILNELIALIEFSIPSTLRLQTHNAYHPYKTVHLSLNVQSVLILIEVKLLYIFCPVFFIDPGYVVKLCQTLVMS